MSNSSLLKFSFIIPTLNEEEFIGGCLDSIAQQMHAHDELIVVDNGSSDQTTTLVRKLKRAVLEILPSANVAALRNRGAKLAQGDVFAFIDGDCTLNPGWRDGAVEVLGPHSVAAAGAPVDLPTSAGWIPRAWWFARPSSDRQVPYLVAANFAIKRDAFHEVSGFRPSLVTDEDTDIGTRLTAVGYRLIESPKLGVVHHDNPETLGDFYRKEQWHATSILQTMRSQSLDKPMAMTFVFLLTVVIAFVGLVSGFVVSKGYLLFSLAIFLVPVTTSVYRIGQGARWGQALQLLILYCLFYTARSSVILRRLTQNSAGNQRIDR